MIFSLAEITLLLMLAVTAAMSIMLRRDLRRLEASRVEHSRVAGRIARRAADDR